MSNLEYMACPACAEEFSLEDTFKRYGHEIHNKNNKLETELAELREKVDHYAFLQKLVEFTNKKLIPGETDSVDALVNYIKELQEKCELYEEAIKRVVDEGIDTSTDGGMDFLKGILKKY